VCAIAATAGFLVTAAISDHAASPVSASSAADMSEPVITAPRPDPSASFQPAAIEGSMDAFGEGVDEGYLEVPSDYANPDAGTFTLFLSRHRATGDRVGSLLVAPRIPPPTASAGTSSRAPAPRTPCRRFSPSVRPTRTARSTTMVTPRAPSTG
jgi:hypothetical protein